MRWDDGCAGHAHRLLQTNAVGCGLSLLPLNSNDARAGQL